MHSMFDIDLLGYSGSIALLETGDVVKAHRVLYSFPLTPHLRGTDEDTVQSQDMRRRAQDPFHAGMLLPYFAIKPLYILTLSAAHKMGFNVIDASRAVSALFYYGIAVTLWLYTRSLLSLAVLVLPEVMLLGQANEPDGMSACLLIFGLWLAFLKHRDFGLLVLLLSVWVRPENALLCLFVIIALLIEGRVRAYQAVVLVVLCFGSEMLINHYGYAWQDLYHHFIGGNPGTGNTIHLSDYARTLAKGGLGVLHSTVPISLLLWLACFPKVSKELRCVMATTLLFSAARFLVFPPYEPRYYGPFFLTTAIAAIVVIKQSDYLQMLSDELRELFSLLRRCVPQLAR